MPTSAEVFKRYYDNPFNRRLLINQQMSIMQRLSVTGFGGATLSLSLEKGVLSFSARATASLVPQEILLKNDRDDDHFGYAAAWFIEQLERLLNEIESSFPLFDRGSLTEFVTPPFVIGRKSLQFAYKSNRLYLLYIDPHKQIHLPLSRTDKPIVEVARAVVIDMRQLIDDFCQSYLHLSGVAPIDQGTPATVSKRMMCFLGIIVVAFGVMGHFLFHSFELGALTGVALWAKVMVLSYLCKKANRLIGHRDRDNASLPDAACRTEG